MTRFLVSDPALPAFYSTDGTPGGTVALELPAGGLSFAGPAGSALAFAGRTYFLGFGRGGSTLGLYSTDGSEGGLQLDLPIGAAASLAAAGLWNVAGHLLVSGRIPGTDTPALYASPDGLNFVQIASGVAASSLVVSNGVGVFGAVDANGASLGLWRTDGTEAGTSVITPANLTPSPTDLTPIADGQTVFASQAAGQPAQLWVTNGASASAVPVQIQVLPAAGSATTGTRAVLAGIDVFGRIAIYSSDGLAPFHFSGTVELLVSGMAGSASRLPNSFVRLGDRVLFDSGYALYVTSGDRSNTLPLTSGEEPAAITASGGQVFFLQPATEPGSIFVTNGMHEGTIRVPVAGATSIAPGSVRPVGSFVVFLATDGSGKTALFQSDGTVLGTHGLSLGDGVPLNPDAPPQVATLPDNPGGAPPAVVTLDGGAQTDVAAPGALVQAGSGADTILATGGGVSVTGGAGTLSFAGGALSSLVNGGTGAATIEGGSGGGRFTGGAAGGNVLVSQGSAGVLTRLTGGGGGDRIFGSASGRDVLVAGPGRVSIQGGGGPTTIQGGAAGSVIFAGSGATQVEAAAGGDTIVGGAGSLSVDARHGEAVFGGAGALSVSGSTSGRDSIVGGAGPLAVQGHGGNMLVVGSHAGSDIQAGTGDAWVFAGSGNLSLTGGAGALHVELGSGAADIVEGSGAAMFDAIRNVAGGSTVLHGFRPGTDHILLLGYGNAERQITQEGGSTLITLSDGSRISLPGVGDLSGSLLG